MLVIRFARTGRKNKAQFRIVVQEHTAAPTGKNVEIVGRWNPHQKEGAFKKERIEYWLSNGAQMSDTVHNLLVSQGIIDDKKRPIKMRSKKNDAESKEDNKGGENKEEQVENNDSDSEKSESKAEEKGDENGDGGEKPENKKE